jgi:hypothetical protein
MTLKIFILAVLFIISGGVAFSEYFKDHKFLSFIVTIMAILATFYLLRDIIDEFRDIYDLKQPSSSTQPITRNDIEQVFNGFIAAWNKKQHRRLISFLWLDFRSVDHKAYDDYHQFSANKQKIFNKHSWLSVTTSNIKYNFDGNEGTVTYYQHYNSPSYESKGTNKLYFRKDGEQTKIFREEFERD